MSMTIREWERELALRQYEYVTEMMLMGVSSGTNPAWAVRSAVQTMSPPLTHEVRQFADDLRGVLDDWGWYDDPANTDPWFRRGEAAIYLESDARGVISLSREGRDLNERYVRHADLLEKWPAEDWWRGA